VIHIEILVEMVIAAKISEVNKEKFTIELEQGSCIDDILEKIPIQEKELPFIMFIVNGVKSNIDKELNAGDHLKILPLIYGG